MGVARRDWGSGAGGSESLAGPSLGSGWAGWRLPHPPRHPGRREKSPPRGRLDRRAHLCASRAPLASPRPPRPEGTPVAGRPRAARLPGALHAARGSPFPAGGPRCWPEGLGMGRRICSTLTTEVTFPAPGSSLPSHTPESPSPSLPASSPRWRWGVLEAGMNLGRSAGRGALAAS